MFWDELWKAMPSVIQAASIAVTAIFAIRSLRAWRTQLVGKRRFEIAEETILAANRAKEALSWIRNPAAFSGEAKEREKDTHESEGESRMKDMYFVPLQRIKDTSEDFAQLSKIKLLAKIHFGLDAAEALQELIKIRHEVVVAARMLVDHVGDKDVDKDFWESLRMKIWATEDEHDVLSPRVTNALARIDVICTPYLK